MSERVAWCAEHFASQGHGPEKKLDASGAARVCMPEGETCWYPECGQRAVHYASRAVSCGQCLKVPGHDNLVRVVSVDRSTVPHTVYGVTEVDPDDPQKGRFLLSILECAEA